jgi:hypothetical protein
MKKFLTILVMVFTLLLLTLTLNAQDRFDRSATFLPNDSLEVGGFGEIVAGVDYDNDGHSEIYFVNNDWLDLTDLVPRIYKYEQNSDGVWELVWWTKLSFDYQNTWPALAAADLDQDGKGEIIWGPVNNTAGGLNPNPARIVVFETPGDGSDNMGVDNGDGTWRPNAQWTITQTANANIRPFKWVVTDIDNDGTDEIVTALRAGDQRGQIYSVDDVPDAADSTETWSLEWEGLGSNTQYDLAVINEKVYYIRSNGDVTKVTYDAVGDSFIVGPVQTGLVPDGSWKTAEVVDLNGDLTQEILVADWSDGKGVWLLQESGDTLTATEIANFSSYTSIRWLNGADYGDVDGDGNIDYIIGTRDFDSPQGDQNQVARVEYQGGDITSPASYSISVIDKNVIAPQGTQIDAICVANLDDDPEHEILYAGPTRPFQSGGPPVLPVTILELIPGNQPIIADVVDVPNDQGRQVWVVWEGSADDVSLGPLTGNNGTISVAVFGPEDAVFPTIHHGGNILTPVRVNPSAITNRQAVISNYVVWRIDEVNGTQYPVQVANVVAIQSAMYAAVVPTLGDGTEWEATFVVSAHTADPLTNWKSFPKNGFSEDNLIPTAPANLTATPVTPDIQLSWDESPDPDFNYFSIRRGDQAGFDPTDPATEVGTTTEPQFMDSNPGGGTWYYRVVAFDFNGNLGEFSEEVSTIITGIEDGSEALPKEFALHQNYPNPFNPETQITFDLPARANVSITIYNMLGQKVRTLVNETKPAGTHILRWDGLNSQGVQVASGVYVYTIRAGKFVQSKKMTFMK